MGKSEDDVSKPAFPFRKDGHKEEAMRVVVLEDVAGKSKLMVNRMGKFQEENKRK